MHKKILLSLFVLFSSFFLFQINYVESYSNLPTYAIEDNCDAILGDPEVDGTVANFLQQIFTIMGYLAPLLCVVLSVVEFVKATASQDKDALMKAMKNTGKRLILAVLLFFLPTLINFIFPLLGWYGTCGIK